MPLHISSGEHVFETNEILKVPNVDDNIYMSHVKTNLL